jgi:predicted RNase H-like nuclease (RuvC/YqgF family)
MERSVNVIILIMVLFGGLAVHTYYTWQENEQCQQENDSLHKKIEQLQTDLEKANARLTNDIEQYKQREKEYQWQISEYTQKTTDLQQIITELQNNILQDQQTIDTLYQEIAQLEGSIASLQKVNDEQKAQIDQLSQQLQEKAASSTTLPPTETPDSGKLPSEGKSIAMSIIEPPFKAFLPDITLFILVFAILSGLAFNITLLRIVLSKSKYR